MIDKHNERILYISAELDAIENKRHLPERTNKCFRKRMSRTKKKKKEIINY